MAAPASHGGLPHWLHHLFSAWAITGAVYLATFWGLTSFIDTSFLALVQAVATAADRASSAVVKTASPPGVKATSAATSGGAASAVPQVIELEPAQYQDRVAFAAWLDKVIRSGPRLLAIEIDLSPFSVVAHREGQAQLDHVIDEAAANHLDIILVPPVSQKDHDDSAWISARCDANVHVASSQLRKQFGWLLRYQPTFPSLGAVAAERLRESGATATPSARPSLTDLCAVKGSSAFDGALIGALLGDSAKDEWQGIDFRQELHVIHPPELPASGSVVFVGSNSPFERIHTPVGTILPVEAHAYIVGTTWRDMPHKFAYALEVVLGVLSGAAFQALWRRRDAAGERHRAGVLASHKVRVWLPHLASVLLLALLFVLVGVALVAAFVLLAIGEFRSGTWLNPAPLVLGMALDSFLSHERELREVPDIAGHPPAWWRHFLARPLAWLALALILVSTAHLITHLS